MVYAGSWCHSWKRIFRGIVGIMLGVAEGSGLLGSGVLCVMGRIVCDGWHEVVLALVGFGVDV